MVCPNCGTDGNLCECALANMPQSRAVTPVTNSPVDVSLAASWPDEAARVARNPDDELAALLQFLRDLTWSVTPAERPPPETPQAPPQPVDPPDAFTPGPTTPGTWPLTGPSVVAHPTVTAQPAPPVPVAPFGGTWTSPQRVQPPELMQTEPRSQSWRKPALVVGALVVLSGLVAGAIFVVGTRGPADDVKTRPNRPLLALPARVPAPTAAPIVRPTVAPRTAPETRPTIPPTTTPATRPTAAPAVAPVARPTVARTAPATRPTTTPARRPKSPTSTKPVAISKAKPARTPSLLSLPATELIERALSDGKTLGWAEVTVTAKGQSLPEPLTLKQVSGPSLGVQTAEGDGLQQVIEVLPGGGVYVEANSDGLNNIMSLPAGEASRLSGWWLSVGPLDNADASFADGITLPSNLSQFNFAGPLTKSGPTRERGQKVLAIAGHNPGPGGKKEPATLYVSVSSDPLPVEEVGADGYGDTIVAVFGHWGEVTDISPPRNAIPLAYEGDGAFLPVPAVPDLPSNLCLAKGPPREPPAAAAYVSSLNMVVPLWISITQSLAANGYVALPQNFVEEASADSELLNALERVNFPSHDGLTAAAFESTLREYIAELELIIRNRATPAESATLGQLQVRLDHASRLLRKTLGMSGTYNCQFVSPTVTASPGVALHIDRTHQG